ncbi:DNA-binding transcriptional MocR family regulator [Novosphingobium sp. PhB165]|uniref:aminotransferase-like domain-containing protein n=1 Tax=Novosphingobium sp. PhB165 TaxID=2485105 RepID=UPI0010E93B2E|nr:PLP-dependent aminotransferase family protein [Novosphingobium sp. PhB165]TCM20552.1 DNA-binding transcriptional MocR family regulator [Novosphingobium sp. PhB165]
MEETQTGRVMEGIRSRISGRLLCAGDRLPSVRRSAASFGVSPATVVEAYDRLVAEGLIEAIPRSGFYVSHLASAPQSPSARAPQRDHEIDPFWVSRQSLDAPLANDKPGCGWLPPDWMPQRALQKALRDLSRDVDLLTHYGTTAGDPVLRRQIALRFAAEGLECDPDQILLTNSGSQAIDLICRLLLKPGDTVLLDDPCYFNYQALIAAHNVRAVSVPYTSTGPDAGEFEAIVSAERPRLYITNSNLHNPTGSSLSLVTAHRLPGIAAAYGMVIVEDDIFADFAPGVPTMAALDGLLGVIRVGSFSKTLSAALRCGYIAARPEWIDALTDLQLATGFGGPNPIATNAISRILAGGGYRRHMEALRSRLTKVRKIVGMRLASMGIIPQGEPVGGFTLWCRLPEDVDSAILARTCLAQDVVLAPGNVFSPSQSAARYVRFNVAQTSDYALGVVGSALQGEMAA